MVACNVCLLGDGICCQTRTKHPKMFGGGASPFFDGANFLCSLFLQLTSCAHFSSLFVVAGGPNSANNFNQVHATPLHMMPDDIGGFRRAFTRNPLLVVHGHVLT